VKDTFVIDERNAFHAQKTIGDLPTDKSMMVTIQKVTRTLAHNAVQWPILNAFSEQLLWPVNGAMVKLSGDEWKDILTAAYRQETTRIAQGLDGGMVMLGHKTREFKKDEWPEWMAFLESVAADRGVKVPMSKRQYESMGYE
jgi:hypothetical protein